jgi:SAM-dependent methyltransferase
MATPPRRRHQLAVPLVHVPARRGREAFEGDGADATCYDAYECGGTASSSTGSPLKRRAVASPRSMSTSSLSSSTAAAAAAARSDGVTSVTILSTARATARHYNDLTRSQATLNRRDRYALPTYPLRELNNKVKRNLISRAGTRRVIYDACCGRGGDILKHAAVKPDTVVFGDISRESVKEARRRFKTTDWRKTNNYTPHFHVLNAFTETPSEDNALVPMDRLSHGKRVPRRFDMIVCNMALHYAFESVDSGVAALKRFSRMLEPTAGVIVATLPSARTLASRSSNFARRSFGNEHYRVDFIDAGESFSSSTGNSSSGGVNGSGMGRPYSFSLSDAVNKCIEYVVDDKMLEEACSRADLEIVWDVSFSEVCAQHQSLSRMLADLDPPLREIATLYRALVMRRNIGSDISM